MFVPGVGYEHSIRAWSDQGDSATVRPGQPLVLHAERRTGPWMSVTVKPVGSDACWRRSMPPSLEPEVAGSVRWSTEPPDVAVFNTDFRPDLSREVRFAVPGVYLLIAEDRVACSEAPVADTVQIVVR